MPNEQADLNIKSAKKSGPSAGAGSREKEQVDVQSVKL